MICLHHSQKPLKSVFRSSILLVFIFSITLTSCTTEEIDSPIENNQSKSIVEILENYGNDQTSTGKSTYSTGKSAKNNNSKPTFKTLSVALAKTGLAGTVSSNRLTVFAPTDQAFSDLGLNQQNIVSVLGLEKLTSILLYHVVGQTILSTELYNGFVSTLNEASVEVNLENGVKINNANVQIADIMARNGIIHAIDSVLMPPMMNITELAIASFGIDSSLVKAVLKAELDEVLANGGPFTVLAPDQNAFDIFLQENNFNSINDVPKDLLAKVLLYHVVGQRVFSDDLTNGYVPTLNGAAVNVNLNSGVMINDSNVISANIQASNGVVHIIDEVLFPPILDIVGVASSFAPEFSILLEAAIKAGLVDTLTNGGPYTVFAPINNAFIELLAGLDGYNSLDDFDTPEDIQLLRSILLYHVVDGRIYSSDLTNGQVPTLNGSTININLDSGVFVNEAEVVIPNAQATNGVIHVINKVLLP